MKPIKLNNDTDVDLEKLIDSRLLVQANSGGGKSWLLRRILEQSHGKVQHIILDPEGEFATLREKYDYILAGKGGDAPAEPRSAAMLAHRLLELNVSAIIDLYEIPPQERKRFVRLFLEAMVNAPKELYHPAIVVIDEAHVFVPQVGESEAAGAVIDLATRGRKRGYCAILATQRISKLHKDAAAECNNKLIGRTGLDVDMKRAADELGFTSREQTYSLRQLEPGEFYAFGPAISLEVQKLKVGSVHTSHPKAGARINTNVAPPTDKIKKILGKLADLPQEAVQEAKTAAELKEQVKQLKRELTSRPKAVENVVQTKIERIEVPAIGKKALEGMKKSESSLRRMLKEVKIAVPVIESSLDRLAAEINRVGNQLAPTARPSVLPKSVPAKTLSPIVPPVQKQSTPALVEIIVSKSDQRVLDAIAWLNTVGVTEPSKDAVALVADYRPTSGGFANILGRMRSGGYVAYPSPNIVVLTEQGKSTANHPDFGTADEMRDKILAHLSEPERKVLRPLIEAYPEALSNDDLAAKSGYLPTSGGFANLKGRLRTFGLVTYPQPNFSRAAEILFP
jgi:hypothetical protein